MKTTQQYLIHDARDNFPEWQEKIQLVVTSPPYPMIAMWDELFSEMSPKIGQALEKCEGDLAFEAMNSELDKVWAVMEGLLCDGGFLCINIGDATRKIGPDFQLFSNHARMITACKNLGFQQLPSIIWWKPTNAPNKFMGSGMLPAGAYVTLEHEYILIFRKKGKREFCLSADKSLRQESAIFWEERNQWFCDSWRISGGRQDLLNPETRKRSAAFPLELAQRLINMYSLKEDWILDPFGGTGTTLLAAAALGRNAICWDIDKAFQKVFSENFRSNYRWMSDFNIGRIEAHRSFVSEQKSLGKEIKHHNTFYDMPVKTLQEKNIQLAHPEKYSIIEEGCFEVEYKSGINEISYYESEYLDFDS
ncbi:MAG: site-specific DNA-methyltransferase [Spirochaetales bacterium]|nr:site-specific DNA-methyltransferase [Spirochaetales bacterium]